MTDYCNRCEELRIFPYRVVQTIYERDTIPCSERINGMIVTVVGEDLTYEQFMLKGGDPCVNENWKPYHSILQIGRLIGHVTLDEPMQTPVTNEALNNMFPGVDEGFRVTVRSLNTTFLKIYQDKWLMSNNVILDYE